MLTALLIALPAALAQEPIPPSSTPTPPIMPFVLVPPGQVVVDANLSEWGTAATLFTISPTSQADFLTFYFMHNDTHLLVAGFLYDPDPRSDDTVTLYINTSTGVQSWSIAEGGAASWYRATVSSTASPFWIFEAAIPNSSIGLSTFFVLIEYENTYRTTYRVYIPTGANMSDPYTWTLFRYHVPPPGAVRLRIRLMDREGRDASILGPDISLMISNETWMSLWLSPVAGELNLSLSPGVYTAHVRVLGCLVETVEINLTASAEWNLSLNNLLIVDTPRGWLAVCTDYVANITAATIEVEKGYGVLALNASDITVVGAASALPWRFTAVLFADNFTYNPLTNRLTAMVGPGPRVIAFVMGLGEPTVYYCNATLTRLTYNAARGELVLALNASVSIKIHHTRRPYAVALNATALRRGAQWWFDDLLNLTTVNCSAGSLTVYYSNPISVEAHASGLTVFISSPYSFHGRIEVVEAGIARDVWVPAGGAEYELDVEPGTYTVRVYDLDSGFLAAEETVTVSAAPAPRTITVVPWWAWALAAAGVAALLIAVARGAARAVVERREYWTKLDLK